MLTPPLLPEGLCLRRLCSRNSLCAAGSMFCCAFEALCCSTIFISASTSEYTPIALLAYIAEERVLLGHDVTRHVMFVALAAARVFAILFIASAILFTSHLLLTGCYGNRCKQTPYCLQHARHNIFHLGYGCMSLLCVVPHRQIYCDDPVSHQRSPISVNEM
jgi:hypothetical protein